MESPHILNRLGGLDNSVVGDIIISNKLSIDKKDEEYVDTIIDILNL